MTDYRIVDLDFNKARDVANLESDVRLFMNEVYSRIYPNFDNWYSEKLVEGATNGSRRVLVATDNNGIAGVSAIKLPEIDADRSKICSFYIAPESRMSGIGTKLLNESLQIIDTSRSGGYTIITVPEERVNEGSGTRTFLEFLQGEGFQIIDRSTNRYRVGKAEYILARCNGLPQIESGAVHASLRLSPLTEGNFVVSPESIRFASSVVESSLSAQVIESGTEAR